ncbi:DUF1592 domain-containing protein [Opitutia bacterium ISCC 51]|nr:DUF1592 domain-containing protein [Opitutae bacterium ISCC 51]QXD29919.1 DUF1592 domain-containing protein [Opitutae bacterium ISCC 52]
MSLTLRSLLLALSSFLFAQSSSALEPLHFIQEHCVSCHGEKKQKGDRRFDALGLDFEDRDTVWSWEEVLDMLNLGEMPPEEQPQPDSQHVKEMVSWITERLEQSIVLKEAQEVTGLRRMNRHEYLNTIRDLMNVNVESFDPTETFPVDEREDGFENLGGTLVLSDYLLERYLDAAAKTVEKAVNFGKSAEMDPVYLVPDDFTARTYHFRPQIWFMVNVDGEYIDFGHGDAKSDRLYASRFKGVPADGFYTIRITAEGVNRINGYDSTMMNYDPEEPIKMQLLATDPRVAYPGRKYNSSDRILATVLLKDHEVETCEFRVWMDKGFVPIIRYPNGPQPFKRILSHLTEKHHLDVVPSNWRDGVAAQPSENQEIYLSDVYEGPRIRFYGMEIHGPETEVWPPRSHQTIFGKQSISPKRVDPEEVVRRFGSRAFRRPLLARERERYVSFHNQQLEAGKSPEEALKAMLTAILASPNFVYIQAPVGEGVEFAEQDLAQKMDPFSLASRLSYFLWSSMPDQALFAAAAKGVLSDPDELRNQVARMLKDPKARAMADQFTDSWLHLNKLGEMPPDTGKFKVYHERYLEPLMKEETRLYFHHVLSNNRPIEEFLDSDYGFVNRYIAELYGFQDVQGDHFRKVRFDDRNMRGGILGHASILTATSNGVETSPVIRGIWILENILGTPPSPPPPDVDPLEPDIRGATTIREQLQKHRKVETCYECHRKIDPLGFAMENYDPIGRYRTVYHDNSGRRTKKIESSGELPSGEQFTNMAELKDILLDRTDQFAHCLTEKLLTYALGRKLHFGDRATVNQICEELKDRGNGLQDLVELVVLSDAFRDV